MTRSTKIFAATTVLGAATSIYLFLDNRSLRADLGEPMTIVEQPAAKPEPTQRANLDARPSDTPKQAGVAPALPEQQDESRMERRQRRTQEFGAMFGRLDNETDEEYRARIMPLITVGLVGPRLRVGEMRKVAEDKAKVTPAQSEKLDRAFDKVYDVVLDYTNKAISDGQLSPYERNVAGWLDYAGGLGGILTNANGQISKILDPGQIKTMSESGFEWGEYLGMSAPWEKLKPPPPKPH